MSDALLDSLNSPPKDPRRHCYFADEWLPSQTPERQAAVQAALANPKWRTSAIFNLLKEYGFERQYNQLRAHRAGECSCEA